MNFITIFFFWLVALVLAILQEVFLIAVFRRFLKFRLSRIVVTQVVLMCLLYAFFFAGAVIDPIRGLAANQTDLYLNKHEPHAPFSFKGIQHVKESPTSGYYIYKAYGGGTNKTLKTTYKVSDETTVIETQAIAPDAVRE